MINRTLTMLALSATILLAGCEPPKASTTQQNAQAVEQNQQRLQTNQPAPTLSVSIERKNLIERLKRLNTENQTGYIYLIDQGTVVAEFATRGKPTSLNAYLMAGEVPTRFSAGNSAYETVMVEQPDYDGAYGENARGIFFFTADTNAYVEWAGRYVFTDQPLSLNSRPIMVRQVK